MSEGAVFAERALLPEGWAENVLIEIGSGGDIRAVSTKAAAGNARRAQGPVIPGMPNLHSHAFQRAMAGLTEHASSSGIGAGDSFWTWRQLMYAFVDRLTPAELEAIAAQLYVEMLKSGYTAVAEFHYLHHDRTGEAYADPATMSERIVAAAKSTGIGLTLLPVLYAASGFGGQPVAGAQRRFFNTTARFMKLMEDLKHRHGADPQIRLGIAPHSLRAVVPEMLREVVDGLQAFDRTAPIHIHIAEQAKEVEDCLAWSRQRPLEWLLSHQDIDEHWCLVHATHATEAEIIDLARSRSVVGLCPTTEANLGDGIFPAETFLQAGGRFGIGSDSHISVSPVEELRWLEYGQRLVTGRRNVLSRSGHVGADLYRCALAGGAKASGRAIGQIARGARADLVVLDGEATALLNRWEDTLLDAFVFAGNVNPIREVLVGGRRLVEDGHHIAEDSIARRYQAAMKTLLD
jgi:formimidoylglutamate deiminase